MTPGITSSVTRL